VSMAKVIVFGGKTLQEPQYVFFNSAITGTPLHGHPRDTAVVVSAQEAIELRDECYDGLPHPSMWNEEAEKRYRRFAGAKVIVDTIAQGYVDREQASFEDSTIDVREVVGLGAAEKKE